MVSDMNDNKQVSLFQFHKQQIRVVEIDGAPWFVGSDALHILYGKSGGIAHVYDVIDADEKRKVKRVHLGMKAGRDATVLSESGLYKLIMRSNKPEAKAFQDWVTREVLPSIRKNGGYVKDQERSRRARCPVKSLPCAATKPS